jgi:hypothetical protein
MQENNENGSLKIAYSLKKNVVITSFFLTSALTVYFLILVSVGFQIDITGIKPGAIVNYNPNTAAAFIVLALSLVILIVSVILFKLIIRMNQLAINAFIKPILILSLILGVIAVGVNILLITKIKIKGIFWPYILFLLIKNPSTLSMHLFFQYDFLNLTNICLYLYLCITLITPGLSCLLVKLKSLCISENKLSNDAGLWLIIVILFPYLIIPLSLKANNGCKT